MAQPQALGMKIGALAEAAGVHVETIRYYQRLGLMPRPCRTSGTVRRYDGGAADRLRFIKRSQGLGFTLEEIRLLLDGSAGQQCARALALAERKKRLIESRVADLERMRASLDRLIRACRTGRNGAGCPIIESLAKS